MHPMNRKQRQRTNALKKKRKRRLCNYVSLASNIYWNSNKKRVEFCDCANAKRFHKRAANRKARREINCCTKGKGYKKVYDYLWKIL